MFLTLSSAFRRQTIAEQAELAVTIKEGDQALEAVRGNAWTQMVASVVTAGSLESVEAYYKDFETEYKAKSGEKKMPSWYRSNKSVASAALEKNVELLDGTGIPRGKSAVEKDLKALKEGSTPLLRITAAFKTINSNLEHDDFDVKRDMPAVRALVDGLLAAMAEAGE